MASTNATDFDVTTDDSPDDQLDDVARPNPEWVDDQFRATGRYDY